MQDAQSISANSQIGELWTLSNLDSMHIAKLALQLNLANLYVGFEYAVKQFSAMQESTRTRDRASDAIAALSLFFSVSEMPRGANKYGRFLRHSENNNGATFSIIKGLRSYANFREYAQSEGVWAPDKAQIQALNSELVLKAPEPALQSANKYAQSDAGLA